MAMASVNRTGRRSGWGINTAALPGTGQQAERNEQLVLITGFGRQLEAANPSYRARDKAVTPHNYRGGVM